MDSQRGLPMTPEDLLQRYEAALASQDWGQVEPLMHHDVCVTFSSGTYRGRSEVGRAVSQNFSLIKEEHYSISDVHWVSKDASYAVCMYHFRWSGQIHGKPASGSGRGTSVLKNEGGRWLVLAEHLGPHAS